MKEHSDGIEREYKFAWDGGEETSLDVLRRFLTPTRVLHKHIPRARLDLYLDTPDRALLRCGASIRLRKRFTKPGWSVNFKPASDAGSEFMARREIRTNIGNDEALAAQLPGLAASECYRLLGGSPKPHLAPVVALYSYRAAYMLRDFSPKKPVDLCCISFDAVSVYDLIDTDVDMLIEQQTFDASRPAPSATFGVLELDAVGRQVDGFWDHDASTIELLVAMGDALKETHRLLRENKYQQAAALLTAALSRG